MDVLRTPDDRFEGLPDWPYRPHYTTVVDPIDGTELRVAHVDEGPGDADPILCLHGEPSWSYLYRHVIRVLVAAGHRVVAPDLVGFGRSDKPSERSDYTYARHVAWTTQWLEALDLQHVTLVCQDWGGLIGLRLVAAQPDRFDRLVAANTFLPTGDRDPGDGFRMWREFSQTVPEFSCSSVVDLGTTSTPGRGARGLRRPVPRPDLRGGRPTVPGARAGLTGGSGGTGQPGGVGGTRALRTSGAVRLQRPGPGHGRSGSPPP